MSNRELALSLQGVAGGMVGAVGLVIAVLVEEDVLVDEVAVAPLQ